MNNKGLFQPGNNYVAERQKKAPIRRAVSRTQKALDGAIDLLGKNTIDNNGATRLSELIAEKLEQDVVGTLSKLQFLFPKNIDIDVTHHTNPNTITDAELASIIASKIKPKDINSLDNMVDDQLNVVETVKPDKSSS